jgi:hypothetical protein
LSSVVIVRRIEPAGSQVDADTPDPLQFQEGRVVPEIGARLPPGAQPSVFFVVYPDGARDEKPRIGVRFLLDGKVIASRTVDLPPPDPSGAIPMTVGAIAQAGNYELRVTALQGAGSAKQSVKYSVAAR